MTIFISWPSFPPNWFTVQKRYSKMYSNSGVNTHHDATTFEHDGMVLMKS